MEATTAPIPAPQPTPAPPDPVHIEVPRRSVRCGA